MEARMPRTKATLMALAEKYHMEFLRHYITDEGYGVYCVSDERIPELDALAADNEWGDAWIFDWLNWTSPPYMYRIICPKNWINLWGWVE